MNLQPWQIISTKIIHSTPWIEVVEDTCVADGKEFIYTYTRRLDEGPLIIAEESDGGLWLVQQYRHPIKKIIWQFPAEGKLPQEEWRAAAERGLQEELHMQAKDIIDLGVFHPDPGGLDQTYHAYLATNLSRTANIEVAHVSASEVEDLRIKKFSREEIDTLIDQGEICDNWTLAGLFLYDRYKKGNS